MIFSDLSRLAVRAPLREWFSILAEDLRRGYDWIARSRPLSAEQVITAQARAQQLLFSLLTRSQRDELRVKGYFSVFVVARGRFCILPCSVFNVLQIETGDCYCAVSTANVPLWDLLLTQKLMLEIDPDSFFSVANCRREINCLLTPEELRPYQVLRSRLPCLVPPVRWSEISAIPSGRSRRG